AFPQKTRSACDLIPGEPLAARLRKGAREPQFRAAWTLVSFRVGVRTARRKDAQSGRALLLLRMPPWPRLVPASSQAPARPSETSIAHCGSTPAETQFQRR